MKNSTINTKGAAKTGDQPTLIVAIEQNFPKQKRIINDNLATKLYAGSNKFWIWATKNTWIRSFIIYLREKIVPGGWSGFLVRKRYIDEKLIEAVQNENIDAIVNLGAGFDTRLYRLPEVKNVPAWEVDQTSNIISKQNRLQKIFHQIPKNIKLVAIDFTQQKIDNVLKIHEDLENKRTFLIWEAVSQYLDESSANQTFDFFSKFPKGSKLVFTYVPNDFITGKNLYGAKTFYKMAVKGNLWHFGLNPEEIAAYLNKYGWQLIEDLDYSDLDYRYVKPTGRKLSVMEIERIVYAEKL